MSLEMLDKGDILRNGHRADRRRQGARVEATVMMAGLAEDDDGGAPLAAVASVAHLWQW